MTTETRSQATATAVLADGDAASTEHRTIHGVAISDDEITNGLHGKKKWVPEELEKAAGTLKGSTVTAAQNVGDLDVEGALIETNHGDRVRVGQITDSAYEAGVGVVYEMDVENEDIYSALALGDLDISIEASNPSDVDEDEETGALIMRDYVFDGMDVVEEGAARSNHTAAGPASNNAAIAALSAQDVSDMLDQDEDDGDAALASSSVHSPTYSGTSTSSPSWADGSWERPSKSQFDDDDLSDIGQHFIASTSGFESPDSYSDLKLPVVEPNGDLNLNGLKAANSRASQTSGLSDDDKSTAKSKIQNLASEEFDEDLGGEEAANEAQEEQAAASESEQDQDRDLDDIESGEDTGLDDIETESEPDQESEQDQESEPEASAGDTDDPSEGEVSADAGSAADDDEDSQTADGGANNDSGTDVKSESDANETEAESEASDEADDADESDSPSDGEEDVAEDDDPDTPESTSGPESSDEVEDGNRDEEAETDAEGGSDDTGAVSSASEANETDTTMADTTPEDDEESTDSENQNQNTPEEEQNEGGQQAGLNLDGQVVIDESRHDELKTKAAMAENLEDENDELKRDLKEREEQIDTVHSVYSAALAEAGPHSEEFYAEMPLETLRTELANTQGVEDDQAALEEAVTNDQPLPQTGDQSAGEGANEAALEEADENAEAALRLDETAALKQREQSAREFVQEEFGVDATEYDDDIELRDAIYGDDAAAAGGDA